MGKQSQQEKYNLILLMTTAPSENAPWYLGRKFPPLGLSYVAASLEKAGFQVQVLDNYLLKKPINEVKRLVKQINPEIVGITCSSSTYNKCVETATAIKEVAPACKIVVGGWHPSYVPDSMLQHAQIDYAIMGEGERAMVELAMYLFKGEKKVALDSIAGVAYKRDGKILKNTPQFIDNLDEIPFPARHLLPMELYERKMEFLDVEPVDIMSIIRGCPFNCAFCETRKMWGPICRFFSPKRVIDEIKHLKDNYASKGIYFINDNFTIRKKETLELCELMKQEKLDIQWICDTRADMVQRELLVKMREAGCKTIWFGVESGSPRILQKINKNISLEQTEYAFKLCRKEGIQIACSFILGVPGETIQDMEATLKFAKKLNPDLCQFNIFIAYPDSSLYEEILQSGNYDKLDDFLLATKTDEFDFKKLIEIQRRFHKEFTRSPRRILWKTKRDGPVKVLKQGFKILTSK
ncbi:MAG: B12-binding domain-containing radical SAM protein [Candidatus Bathyarchaeota archaeon]|nr:B12-binding domain-containing radical SAM protein [Candidatus Bathyarchaeota archaeon]